MNYWSLDGPNRDRDKRSSAPNTRYHRIRCTIASPEKHRTIIQDPSNADLSNIYGYNGEHHLGDVERVPPIVIRDVPVVFLNRQQPPAQHLVVHVKPFD